jgi:hypothetical protein
VLYCSFHGTGLELVQCGAHIHSAVSKMYNNQCSSLVKSKICLAFNF